MVCQMTGADCKAIVAFWDHPDFQEAWLEWWRGDLRKAKKCSATERATTRALNKLKDFSGGNMKKAIAILDRSSDNGWTDLYALPDDYGISKTADRPPEVVI
jgi:hypothetical protein